MSLQERETVFYSPSREWGPEEAKRYEKSRHGADGRLFLDPRINDFLDGAKGQVVIDVGAGAGPVSIEAIRRGARLVLASDKYPAMVELAKAAVIKAEMVNQIEVREADVANLPYANETAGRVVSVNVACNLDNHTLAASFDQMARVVRPDGLILVTLPIHLGEIFTNGDTEGMQNKLSDSMCAINEGFAREGIGSQGVIQRHLGDIVQIHRGTFVAQDGRTLLVSDQPDVLPDSLREYTVAADRIEEGQPIWRKLSGKPGLVVPNYWHLLSTYEKLMQQTKLNVVEKYIDCFKTKVAMDTYNLTVPEDQPERKLGQEYVGKGPFAVYVLQRT